MNKFSFKIILTVTCNQRNDFNTCNELFWSLWSISWVFPGWHIVLKCFCLCAGVPRPRSGAGGAAAGGEGRGPGGWDREDPPGPGRPPGPRRLRPHPPQPGGVAAHHRHPARTHPGPPGRWVTDVSWSKCTPLFLFLQLFNVDFRNDGRMKPYDAFRLLFLFVLKKNQSFRL